MLSTCHKIRIVRTLSSHVQFFRKCFGRTTRVIVTRRGVTWVLDLREGIDFAIYLLGGFELRTLRSYPRTIKAGDTVLDVGANIGAHTLPFAQLVGSPGKVFSFESTAYAFAKQKTNISLTPRFAAV
jgi:hypothetical protein